MSKRFLILAGLLMAAILVSGCCCCWSGNERLYGPASPSIRPSATPVIVTVIPVNNTTLIAPAPSAGVAP